MVNSVTVRAPSSTANLGPGFDVFGLALDAFFDEVKLSKKKERGIKNYFFIILAPFVGLQIIVWH